MADESYVLPSTFHKAVTFTSQPTPPYYYIDSWLNNGKLYGCCRERSSGESFVAEDWVALSDYASIAPTYETIIKRNEEYITDFSDESLANYEELGAIPYAVYDDGTEVQVTWDQVSDPAVETEEFITEAEQLALANNQHFWSRDTATDGAGTGAFVTDEQQDAFLEAAAANFPNLGESGKTDTWIGNGSTTIFNLSEEAANTNYQVRVGNTGITTGITKTTTGFTLTTAPANGVTVYAYYTTTKKPWHNILMNVYGIAMRMGTKNLLALTKSAMAFYDGTGNEESNVTARFGANSAQIGKTSENHTIIDSRGVSSYDGQGNLAPMRASYFNELRADKLTATSAYIDSLTSEQITASNLIANIAKVANLTAEQLSAATAYIASLTANSVTANQLAADHATVNNLNTTFAHITNGVIDNAKIGHADVNGLSANYATISNLNAATGRIDTLEANDVTINSRLTAAEADIGTLNSSKASITLLESDYITADEIDAGYMQVDMSNSDVAWIQNGTIKDGAITNAMINSVSANKLTAGTIDASNITVTNLNASNITTGTINGQRIGTGSLSLDKLSDDVYTETEVDNLLATMQSEIDGAIETWTGTAVPTLTNTPASTWTSNSDKDKHVGDVYFVVNSQSQQNGYNYRFTKSGTGSSATYSWELIKDTDITNALSRLSTAEGKIGTIEAFDTTISSWKTDTDAEISSIKSAATTLAGRVTTAEGDIATKVDATTFNTLSQTVDSNSSSITQLTNETTTITEKITLDKPYKEVEWIESNGQQYIYLDWSPSTTTFGFYADFISRNNQSTSIGAWNSSTNLNGYGNVFGVRNAPNVNDFQFVSYGSGGLLRYGGGKAVSPVGIVRNERQTCSLINNTFTKPDGTEVAITRGVDNSDKPYQNMTVFAMHEGPKRKKASGGFVQPGSVRIYSLKFFENETVVVDLVPAIKTIDSTPGLWDKISEHFYPARGALYGDAVDGSYFGHSLNINKQFFNQKPSFITSNKAPGRLWQVEAFSLNELVDGQQIVLTPTYNSAASVETIELSEWDDTSSNADVYIKLTLSDNVTTDWIPVYMQVNAKVTRFNTQMGSGSPMTLTYCEDILWNVAATGGAGIARGWFMDPVYYNNTNTVTDKIANSVVAGKNGIKQYSLIMKDDEGNWTSLTTTAGTALTKIAYSGALQFQNVAYTVAGGNYNPDAQSGEIYNSYALDVRYSMNVAINATTGLIAREPVYLVGEVRSDGYFYLDTPWWTQTVPTEADGKTYIYLGIPYSYYQMWLAGDNTIYRFIDGEFVPVYIHTIERTVNRVNEVTDTVGEHTRKIGVLETTVETKADSSTVTTISNNLNTVSDTVSNHTQTISSIQTTLSSKADSDDLDDVADRVSTAESTISQHTTDISLKANSADTYTKTQTDGLISTEVTNRNTAITAATNAITLSVSQTYATKTYVDDGLEDANDYTDTEVASAKAAIKVTTDGISTEVAKKTDKTAIISTINQTAETVKIAASKVDITGEAVFNAINNDTGTTKINGGKIDATSITLGYSQITNTPAIPTKTSDLTNDSSYATTSQIPTKTSDLTNDSSYATTSQIPTKTSDLTNDSSYATTSQVQDYADAKDTAIAAAAKRTYVSIRATAVDYSANTATLEATLYIDGTATITGVSYKWFIDGTEISGETSRTYSVPASSGLSHAYSCKCTTTV